MDLVFAILAATFAGVMQAAVGFGFAVAFTPLMTLVVGARSAVASAMLLSVPLSFALYLAERPRAAIRGVLPMVLAATVATPLGVAVLARADERFLRAAIGVLVLGSVALSLVTPRATRERPGTAAATVGIGLLSGVLRGATSMGGPPVVLYEHWRGAPAAVVRSRLLAFFALGGVATVAIAGAGGVITRASVLHAAVALPAVALSMAAGRWLRPRLSDRWFRALSMGLLTVMGALSLAGAVR